MVSIEHLLMIINSILSVKFLAKHWTWSLSFKTCYGREVLQSQNWYKIYWFENRCIWYNRFLPFRRLLWNNISGYLTSPPHNVIQKKQSNVFILCSLWFTYIATVGGQKVTVNEVQVSKFSRVFNTIIFSYKLSKMVMQANFSRFESRLNILQNT